MLYFKCFKYQLLFDTLMQTCISLKYEDGGVMGFDVVNQSAILTHRLYRHVHVYEVFLYVIRYHNPWSLGSMI